VEHPCWEQVENKFCCGGTKMIEFITDEFVEKVREKHPKPLNEIGEFVYYRTYSRWLNDKGRREYWHETCKRSVNYNFNLEYRHMKKQGYKPDVQRMKREAESFFFNQYTTKQFLSGRTLFVGGEKVSEKYPLANFNCAFTTIEKWEDLVELFYLLMIGTGVGFKCTKELAKKLKPMRNNFTLISSEYKPLPKNERLEKTELTVLPNGYAKIFVGDSKEGWCQALNTFFDLLTESQYENIHTIKINYNSIRPKGEKLKTFGGTASGHKSLEEMFIGFEKVLKNEVDPYLEPLQVDDKGYVKLRPIHVLDFGNLIGANVVVGGVENRLAPR
jgi:ribonucleoside-triphosphate reductase (thioredoxin)